MASRVPDGSAALVVADPFVAWAQVAALFHAAPEVVAGVHPTAVIAQGLRMRFLSPAAP